LASNDKTARDDVETEIKHGRIEAINEFQVVALFRCRLAVFYD